MLKNIFLFTVIIILLIVALSIFSASPKGIHLPVQDIQARYSDGKTVVLASFDNTAHLVTFTLDPWGAVTLKQAISGSGARYVNKDESIVFWEHQGELTITKNGKEAFRGLIER